MSKDLITLVNSTDNPSGDKEREKAAGEKLGKCVVEAGMPLDEIMALGEKLTNM